MTQIEKAKELIGNSQQVMLRRLRLSWQRNIQHNLAGTGEQVAFDIFRFDSEARLQNIRM